uniref:Uncharacterized protein n=1 Tax=Podoviridae sp. ctlMy11 TaxID=2827746 RepID=A0A8S5TCG6_9CAUD|nr:MAG TPA: hypothetical protein [Podoviridae sp. ctlMy11]
MTARGVILILPSIPFPITAFVLTVVSWTMKNQQIKITN